MRNMEELARRQRERRRAPLDAYIGRRVRGDRRALTRTVLDNARVGHWMQRFDDARRERGLYGRG